jgi:hypothetical protein
MPFQISLLNTALSTTTESSFTFAIKDSSPLDNAADQQVVASAVLA